MQLCVIDPMAPHGTNDASMNAFESHGQLVPFVPNDEPLFGLDCQESARVLVPFCLALLTHFLVGRRVRGPRRPR
jgi:hypothetical protein